MIADVLWDYPIFLLPLFQVLQNIFLVILHRVFLSHNNYILYILLLPHFLILLAHFVIDADVLFVGLLAFEGILVLVLVTPSAGHPPLVFVFGLLAGSFGCGVVNLDLHIITI